MARLAPSILSADFAALARDIADVTPEADMLHVDVMDGHFVPNLTIGPPVVKSLRGHTDLYFDCHLMIDNPGTYLERFADAGANGCSVHVELDGTRELLEQMRRLHLDVGLAVNPEIDLLLVMTVHPGFGGQSFMYEVMPKLTEARRAIDRRGLRVALQVDGGINEETAPVAAAAGADTFVAGNAIFGAGDALDAARRLRAAIG